MKVFLFLLGVYLSIRSIAALYRVIDLWYSIRTMWPTVVRGVLVWAGGTAALAWQLPEAERRFLIWGLAAYVLFYLGTFLIVWRLLIPRLIARNLGEVRT